MAPYSFLTARELVSKSHDSASFKKSTRKSRANKHNEMSTNMASKFLKKIFWNSCASLCQFKNINRMNTTRYPSVLNTKGKSTRFAGDSIIYPVVTRVTRMGQNNAVCYPTYLQSLLFMEETLMKMKIPLNLE